jgi:hypothetical protein
MASQIEDPEIEVPELGDPELGNTPTPHPTHTPQPLRPHTYPQGPTLSHPLGTPQLGNSPTNVHIVMTPEVTKTVLNKVILNVWIEDGPVL